jgi:hypothetical protein
LKVGPTAAGERFLVANRHWWLHNDFTLHRDIANAIYHHLTARLAFDPDEDATYDEVASRMQTLFPDLLVVSRAVEQYHRP